VYLLKGGHGCWRKNEKKKLGRKNPPLKQMDSILNETFGGAMEKKIPGAGEYDWKSD